MQSPVKFSAKIFLLCIAVASLTASAAATNIEVWHSMPAGAALNVFEEIVDEFAAANPDVNAEVIRVGGYTQAFERMQVAWAGGTPPNIGMAEQARSRVFVDEGVVLPLEPFMATDPTFSIDDLVPPLRASLTYDGRLYGIPFNTSTPVNYYNRNMFSDVGLNPDTPPATWDELLSQSQSLSRDTDGDGNPDTFGISYYRWGWLFEAWIGQNGARILNADETAFVFNSPEAIGALQFTQDLVHQYRVADYGGGASYFFPGRVAMTEGSTASLANNTRSAADAGFDLGVASLVCNTECYAPIGGGGFLMFDTGTQAEKDASWRFLSYISSPENYARFAEATGYMVARLSAFDLLQDLFAANPRARVTYDQINYAHPRPQVPFWELIHDELGKIYQVQMVEAGDFRPALDNAVRLGNQLLAEWHASR